jgi:hypothetical protein
MHVGRTAVLAFAALTAAVGTLSISTAAQAQTVESGSFTMTGDPGDYISGGQDWNYDTDNGDGLTVYGSSDNNHVEVAVDGYNGDWWYANFQAPGGQPLQPGTNADATRYPFNGTGPGLDISGEGRGCNTLTGTFTIAAVSFGPSGYVEDLDVTFEQHCEGSDPAARGHIVVHNPPAPAALAVTASAARTGTFDRVTGKATVSGTASCSSDATVQVQGDLTQVKQKTIIRGTFGSSLTCKAGEQVAWSATVTPTGTTPYQLGRAEVAVTATATDPVYGNQVSDSDTETVLLTRS